MTTVPVAYEDPRRGSKGKPLDWHKAVQTERGTSLMAKGQKGPYVISPHKPDRRHGIGPWHLHLGSGSETELLRTFDRVEQAKRWAEKYDARPVPEGGPPAPDARPVPAPVSDEYEARVRELLVKMGSPSPDADIDKSRAFIAGQKNAGIEPAIAAGIIDATLHHAHVKTSVFTEAMEGARWTRSNTRLETWFERDRAYVGLEDPQGRTIIEWWDEAVQEAVEDGFLNPRDYHGSAVEYANHIGARPKRKDVAGRRSGEAKEAPRRMAAFDVYLNGRHIDTVFYQPGVDAAQVKRDLVQHDGLDPSIDVRHRQQRAAAENRKRPKHVPRYGEGVVPVNSSDASFTRHRYVLWFGAYGSTRLLVWANNLDDALDEAVDWIADHAPGLLADDAVKAEYDRQRAEGKSEEEAMTEAELDTTVAGNSGHYINSWQWGVVAEDPTRAQLLDIEGRARHSKHGRST